MFGENGHVIIVTAFSTKLSPWGIYDNKQEYAAWLPLNLFFL